MLLGVSKAPRGHGIKVRARNVPASVASSKSLAHCESPDVSQGEFLRLTFPRAKLRRQIFTTRAEVWAKNWAKFSAYFRASFAVQNDPQIFSQNSSQFIAPCLVTEIIKFYLPVLLGLGGSKNSKDTQSHRSSDSLGPAVEKVQS